MSLSLSTAGLTNSCPGREEVTQRDKERRSEKNKTQDNRAIKRASEKCLYHLLYVTFRNIVTLNVASLASGSYSSSKCVVMK